MTDSSMKQIVILLIGFFTVNYCYGQDAIKKNSLSLSFGPGYIIRQDVMFSPFIHSDLSFMNVGLVYTHQAKIFQKVSLRYGNYTPSVTKPYDFTVHGENVIAYPHNFNLIDIDYLIGKAIVETEKSNLKVGGAISADIQALNYVYGRISSFGYYSAFGLGIFGRHSFIINDKNRIVASLQLPFLAWLSRPPYMGIDDEFIEDISSHSGLKTFMAFISDGELVTWNRLQTFDAAMYYTYSLNEKWDLGAGYLFEFVHASQPQNLVSFRNSINISLTFRF
jgi:hypothetical protein